jgi:hypothetical protein
MPKIDLVDLSRGVKYKFKVMPDFHRFEGFIKKVTTDKEGYGTIELKDGTSFTVRFGQWLEIGDENEQKEKASKTPKEKS